jgi:glycerol-3-phosphate dehydrogenase
MAISNFESVVEPIDCDLLVIGGGVNGTGIARDAVGRGLSVVLCEKDDLASHTSGASSKLIHGGLRYLQYYEFGLVRKALIEREVLLRSAPHLITPLHFVMPHVESLRPAWMLRCGLFLYDHLARRQLLGRSRAIDLHTHPTGAPLKPKFRRGYRYSDAYVDDARLVALNAVDAAERGARVFTRTRCESMTASKGAWRTTLRGRGGSVIRVNARCIANATGSWAMEVRKQATPASTGGLRLVKGSHIVVRRIFEHDDAYILQHGDGRIVFAIPYQRYFTIIGTTDVEYRGDAGKVAISAEEVDYLCQLSSSFFRTDVRPSDVVWSYAGVRSLVDDGTVDASAITRDYRLDFDTSIAPLLTIFGGKITTYRKLSEEAVDRITAQIQTGGVRWTEKACLPGGDIFSDRPENRSVTDFGEFVLQLERRYPWLPGHIVSRYARAYGTRAHRLLGTRTRLSEMGRAFSPDLYEREVRYLMDVEWARTAEDVLWRRTKLGLSMNADSTRALDTWMQHAANPANRNRDSA